MSVNLKMLWGLREFEMRPIRIQMQSSLQGSLLFIILCVNVT